MQFISGQAKGLNITSKTYLTQVMNMEFAITKMSSKGQIVIPVELREGIKEGDKLIIIKNDSQLIMKKASKMDKALKEDLEFAERTERAWKEYEQGKFKKMSFDEFLAEAKKW
jgi:AbrB family looped-hinge helix DNA binding protein